MKKTVSVNIVTYNSENDIIACLEGISVQNYPIKQVVVVDNASMDKSVERVKVYSDKLNLLCLQNSTNTGFAFAHNMAISSNDTDYVLVLNPDVTLTPDYISKLIAKMEKDSQFGSATGKLLRKNNHDMIDSTGLWMNKARRAFDRGAGEIAEGWIESGPVFGVSGAAALYSRSMIKDISINDEFFDADFFAYKEDVDVAWRAQLLGWKSYYEAEAIGFHERSWKQSSRSNKPIIVRQFSYINRYKMIYKNEKIASVVKTLLFALPYEILANCYILFKEPNVLRAWKSFFIQFKNLREKRNFLQNKIRFRERTIGSRF